MSNNLNVEPLSKVELLVLSRLASKKGASAVELANVIDTLAPDEKQAAPDALVVLRHRSLVTAPPSGGNCKLTTAGRATLCKMLSITEAPTWSAVRSRCLSVLQLARPNPTKKRSSPVPKGKTATTKAQTLAALQRRFQMANTSSLSALCDSLLSEALGFGGKVTLRRLRAHILAQRLGLDASVSSTMTAEEVAKYAADRVQDSSNGGKRTTQEALSCHGPDRVAAASSAAQQVTAAATPHALLFGTDPFQSTIGASPLNHLPPWPPPEILAADKLLNLVQEAIPRIGSDGRFGPEKVFVSALWRHIEDDGRLPDLSLDGFKCWLLTANRDRLVDLARADSQGDMDGRLLEESEIRDLGATFHFVIDREIATSRRGYHAR
jgi:hypothetical protein